MARLPFVYKTRPPKKNTPEDKVARTLAAIDERKAILARMTAECNADISEAVHGLEVLLNRHITMRVMYAKFKRLGGNTAKDFELFRKGKMRVRLNRRQHLRLVVG